MKFKRKKTLATTLVETLPPIGLAGILATSILPALSKAKARANRITCVSNLKHVGSAFKSFANDNDSRYPWLLSDTDKIAHGKGFGFADGSWVYETQNLFAHPGIKSDLGSAKILVSPLDPERQAINDTIDFAQVKTKVDNAGHSYGVGCGDAGGKGADDLRPSTVLIMTRNISAENLSGSTGNGAAATISVQANWLGAGKQPTNPRVMASLNSNSGQIGQSDGSAGLSNDLDLAWKTKAHHSELGGNYKGTASGVIDTPND
ncbi:MAG: hypothetical protein CMO66_01195 [Verrucomicrobiales bacterium]|nr:hypothetical protein [Verrucomicrobiales bacterium]